MEQWTRVEFSPALERDPARLYSFAKRILDITISSLLLLILLPLLLPVALAIRLDSRGPVFHRRRVVGQNGSPFNALKLRTMVQDGTPEIEKNAELMEELQSNHKIKQDPRVTRVGKILRKTSIDELPQLANVLKGDMSLVGPRMISFPELDRFGIWQDHILKVKPGITGLWQVSGRSDLDYDDRVRLNVYYVSNRSILLDLSILARTIPAVFSGRGAY